jgi:hypothetical protein
MRSAPIEPAATTTKAIEVMRRDIGAASVSINGMVSELGCQVYHRGPSSRAG